MSKFYALGPPSIGPAEIRAVTDVLKSGYLSLGPVHKTFEKNFAKAIGTKYAVSVSSGTAGLHLAMLAAGIGPGDEVITSPFSFIASSNAVLYVGAKPVFVDIDPMSYNMDPERIERAITKRTKAILVVHIFGQACDMTAITKIARKHKLKIIEDACEAVMATHNGKRVGTFGESAVFAFYPNKQMTTGEGGMLVTNSAKVAEQCRSLANQGRAPNMQWLDHQTLGYNYRLDEMSAALGVVQLKRLTDFIQKRRQIAGWYNSALSKLGDGIVTPEVAPGNKHTYFVYVIQTPAAGKKRDALIERMAKLNVQTKPYLPSIHLFSFYRKQFGFKRGDFLVSEGVSDRSLALPFHVSLTKHDVNVIVSRLAQALRSL